MPLFPEEMESERLQYERLHPEEFDPFELYQHVKEGAPGIDEVTEYVSWDPYEHPKKAFDWVDSTGSDFDEHEAGHYVMRPKDGDAAGEFAGLTSIHPDWDRRMAVFGTWFRKPFWGRGYSGERAARMLELVFDRLDLNLVAVAHAPGNEKSRRAIEKYVERFGGRKEGHIRNSIILDGEPRDSIRYSISREEWERNREQ